MTNKETKRPYKISEVASKEWKDWALYTITSRAIPHIVDGLKPVQRMFLYSSIVNTPKEFKRLSAVAGPISDYGYHHGEGSAAAAGQLMAAPWNNNICLIEGRGSYGTRLSPSIGAPRYVNSRLHSNFHKFVTDIDLAPKHPDPEHLPPKYYTPVIPLVLVNGVKGIATGFSTSILPHDPVAIAEASIEYINTGDIKTRIPVKYPDFTGTVTYDDVQDRYTITGVFKRIGKTRLVITDVPYGVSREDYITHLNLLVDQDKIIDFDDNCDKTGFNFDVKLKNATGNLRDDQLVSLFKLSARVTQNLTVIDWDNRLREYKDPRDLIKDFVNHRMSNPIAQRIDKRRKEVDEALRWAKIKRAFVMAVIEDQITFRDGKVARKKTDIVADIINLIEGVTSSDADRLLRMAILSFTEEVVKEIDKEVVQLDKEHEFWWHKTDAKKQALGDLKELIKAMA